MSTEGTQKLSFERIILIVVSILLVIAIAYIAVSSILRGREEPTAGTVPGEATPAPIEQAGAEQPAEAKDPSQDQPVVADVPAADVTPTPRRLAVEATPTPFQVTSEDDPRAILDLSNPDHHDYFDTDNWYDYDTENVAAYRVEDGYLYGIDYMPEESFVYWTFTNVQSGNVYAEITATNGDCIEKDSVGLNIRFTEELSPSGYAIEVSCDGSWRFRRHRGGKTPEELIDWTTSDAINVGPFAENRLGIWGYQGKFYFFVNGFQVGEFFDADYAYTFGYFSVYVRASRTFDLTATFDDFAFWHIPFIP